MYSLWSFLTHHWLSAVLLIGAFTSIYYVYSKKDKLFFGANDNK